MSLPRAVLTRWCALLAAVVLSLSGCHLHRTQLIVCVTTDMSQGPLPDGTLSAIQIQLTPMGGTPLTPRVYQLGGGAADALRLPASLGIEVPNEAADSTVVIEVTAIQGDNHLFTVRKVGSFVANTTSGIEVFLADRCRYADRACPGGQTCGRSGCEPEAATPLTSVAPCETMDAGVSDVSCPANQLHCASGCVDPATDPTNCGGCDIVCPGTACVAGACSTTLCQPGRLDCNNNRADGCESVIATDPMHCGSCRIACTAAHGTPACRDGACALDHCDPGFTHCASSPGLDCDVETSSDVANCGACGHACATANNAPTCSMGACVAGACDPGFANCSGNPDTGCETAIDSDLANCGGCGAACAPANAMPECFHGQCAIHACNPGFDDCDHQSANGCEAALATDAANCGGCGHACAFANAAASCVAAACQMGACLPGFSDCDHDPTDGCEADLSSGTNCGACGTRCGSLTPVCVRDATGVYSCAAGCPPTTPTRCAATMSCVDAQSDVQNCGACGHSCETLAHVVPTAVRCTAGACALPAGACAPGWADCDGVASNGCEADLSQPSHCGACASACAEPTPVCLRNAMTGAYACASGCSSSMPLRCAAIMACVDPQTDPRHCGGCTNDCTTLPHVRSTAVGCASGVCSIPATACQPGWADCDGNPANGCEADLTSSATCGRCGHACPSGGACSAGGFCPGEIIRSASLGYQFAFATFASGAGDAWGTNSAGQLGVCADPTMSPDELSATPITVFTDWTSISGRDDFACGLRTNNQIFCWGNGAQGRRGYGTAVDGSGSRSSLCAEATKPVLLPLGETGFRAVVVGPNTSYAIGLTGTLYCWGANGAHECGTNNGADTAPHVTPVAVSPAHFIGPVTTVAAGLQYACATNTAGIVACWGGANPSTTGMLGYNVAPEPVANPAGVASISWRQAVGGTDHYCVLSTTGLVYCAGDNATNQLGTLPANTPVSSRALIQPQYQSSAAPLSTGGAFVELAAGDGFTCGRRMDSTVWCWGKNTSGELGAGTMTPYQAAVQVQGLPAGTLGGIAAGQGDACVWYSDTNQMWCWGANSAGQLGNGTVTPSLMPTRVSTLP